MDPLTLIDNTVSWIEILEYLKTLIITIFYECKTRLFIYIPVLEVILKLTKSNWKVNWIAWICINTTNSFKCLYYYNKLTMLLGNQIFGGNLNRMKFDSEGKVSSVKKFTSLFLFLIIYFISTGKYIYINKFSSKDLKRNWAFDSFHSKVRASSLKLKFYAQKAHLKAII